MPPCPALPNKHPLPPPPLQVSMQQASIDPRTGQIDMDVIQTGVSAADRTMRAALAGELRGLLEQHVSHRELGRVGWWCFFYYLLGVASYVGVRDVW